MNKDKQNQICRVMAENIILRTKARTLARENEKLRKLLKSANDGFEYVEDEKAKAIKAFAEKLKEKALIVEIADYEYGVLVDDIDELVKEMTEVKDNDKL